MRRYLKLVVAIAAILILAVVLFIVNSRSHSQFTLTASENKFKVDFQLSKYDQILAQSFLSEANIPGSILDGLEFTLDGTSSARLAYISPITTSLNFQKNKLDFRGITQTALVNKSQNLNLNINVPDELTVALFGENLTAFIKRQQSKDFSTWLDNNLKSANGHYLILFGDKPDFALVFKKQTQPDFEKLKSLKEEEYKEETQDNITFHLVKDNYVFFEMDDLVFAVSSFDAAKNLAHTKKDAFSKSNIFESNEPVAFALLVKNSPEHKADSALKFLVGDEQKVTDYLEKVKIVHFYLQGEQFHGSVELLPK